MQQNLKKVIPPNNKQAMIQSYCVIPPIYDITPPSPLPYPKMIHYQLDGSRHYGHKFNPSFIYNSKPLLVGADVGMDLDQLVIFAKSHNNTNKILDEQDQMLINQTIMNVKYDISRNNVKQENKIKTEQ